MSTAVGTHPPATELVSTPVHLLRMEPGVLRERLRTARDTAGLSQNAAARATGLSLATIQNWESGRRTNISAADVARAADAYGVTTDWLLGRSDGPLEMWRPATEPDAGGGGPLAPDEYGPAGRSPRRGSGEAEGSA